MDHSLLVSEESLQGDQHSLIMVEVVLIGVLLLVLTTFLLASLAKLCQVIIGWQEGGDLSSIPNNVLANQRQLLESRKRFLESHLTTFQVKKGIAANDSSNTDDIIKLKKGDLILSSLPKEEDDDNNNSDDDDDANCNANCNNGPMCAICVSPYQVGDLICWSNHRECHHCFHTACIQQWLLRHSECPCCRLPFLVQDDNDDKDAKVIALEASSSNVNDSSPNRHDVSTQEEAWFQRMVAGPQNSYRSMLPWSTSISPPPTENQETTTQQQQSGNGEQVLQERQHRIHNTADLVNSSDSVDIELGVQAEHNNQDKYHVSGEKEGSSTAHEETHRC